MTNRGVAGEVACLKVCELIISYERRIFVNSIILLATVCPSELILEPFTTRNTEGTNQLITPEPACVIISQSLHWESPSWEQPSSTLMPMSTTGCEDAVVPLPWHPLATWVAKASLEADTRLRVSVSAGTCWRHPGMGAIDGTCHTCRPVPIRRPSLLRIPTRSPKNGF